MLTLESLMTLLSLCATFFALGYSLGNSIKK